MEIFKFYWNNKIVAVYDAENIQGRMKQRLNYLTIMTRRMQELNMAEWTAWPDGGITVSGNGRSLNSYFTLTASLKLIFALQPMMKTYPFKGCV